VHAPGAGAESGEKHPASAWDGSGILNAKPQGREGAKSVFPLGVFALKGLFYP
jgi:hypothetical protein